MAKPVGPIDRKRFEGFLPSGGPASFPECQNVFPAKTLANRHDGLAGVKGDSHQAEGRLWKLLFEPLTEALEALEFICSNLLLAGLGEAGGHVFHIRPIRKERKWKMRLAMDLQETIAHLALEQITFFVSVRPFLALRR
jgi:hypothetical protein